ncbi:hypothetical protein UlMin_023680 [Ulmus minor]
MVWGLFPLDPVSGESKYYIFATGSYKVGRKGCDIIITKDKGVSRVHAEVLVDVMTLTQKTRSSSLSCNVRIKDCSKYGTFINKNLGSMEKVHEFPNKETSLTDGNLISFGTGNATYRFCFVPIVFWVYSLEPFQTNLPLQDKLSSIGARVTNDFSQECTHVLVDDFIPLKEDLLEAIVEKKACVVSSWVESVAEEKIRTEIPSCSSHTPTIMVEGVSVKLADQITRESCLKGYTFVLESTNSYKFRDRLQSLLEASGAKTRLVEGLSSSSQVSDHGENNYIVCVIPGGSADKFGRFNKLSSVSRVNEIDLLSAVLAGNLDRSIFISPCVVVSTSCSTDETIVADSEEEAETATSTRETAALHSEEVNETVKKLDNHATSSFVLGFRPSSSHTEEVVETVIQLESSTDNAATNYIPSKRERDGETESGNLDIIYTQELIVRNLTKPSTAKNEVLDFKCFRKRNTQSGNSLNSLVPFSKYPYKESDCQSEEVAGSIKEEKRRKQMEAVAEDLFNHEKGRRRGVAGSLPGLLSRG